MANSLGGRIVLGLHERTDGSFGVRGIADIERVEALDERFGGEFRQLPADVRMALPLAYQHGERGNVRPGLPDCGSAG